MQGSVGRRPCLHLRADSEALEMEATGQSSSYVGISTCATGVVAAAVGLCGLGMSSAEPVVEGLMEAHKGTGC